MEVCYLLPWAGAEGVVTEEDLQLAQNAIEATTRLYLAMRRKEVAADAAGLLTATLAGQPSYLAKVIQLPEVRQVGSYLAAFHPRKSA